MQKIVVLLELTIKKKVQFSIQTDRFNKVHSDQSLTQARLAKLMGVSEDVLSKMKHGELLVERSILDILCRHLDCSPEWLIGLSEHRYPYKNAKISQLARLAESLPEHTLEAVISLFMAIRDKKIKILRIARDLLNSAIDDEVLGDDDEDRYQK